MSETLEATRAMVEATSIPIIADCDGFGNAINVMRTVADFRRPGVPRSRSRTTSSEALQLTPASRASSSPPRSTRAGRGREGGAVQRRLRRDRARTEALIAGWGKEEALSRARAYADAGADAILIHSKHPDLERARRVAAAWDRDVPLGVGADDLHRRVVRGLERAG